jgi:hypothetical protein
MSKKDLFSKISTHSAPAALKDILLEFGDDPKKWDDFTLAEAIVFVGSLRGRESANEGVGATRFSPELDGFLWNELFRRLIETSTHIHASLNPATLLSISSDYSLIQHPSSGKLTARSLHLLPAGYMKLCGVSEPGEDRDESSIGERLFQGEPDLHNGRFRRRTFGDPRYQQFWINAFYGDHGLEVIYAHFPPYDKTATARSFNNETPSEELQLFDYGEPIQEMGVATLRSYPAAESLIYNSLVRRVILTERDEGYFWKSLREEIMGMALDYVWMRERDIGDANRQANYISFGFNRNGLCSAENLEGKKERVKRKFSVIVNRWLNKLMT